MFKCNNMMRTRTFIITTVIYASISAKPLERPKRFASLTPPTPYAIPTSFPAIPTKLPRNATLGTSALVTSTPVRCLRKRDTGTSRIPLDSAMLRELYLVLVGTWDMKFQAETEEQLPHILNNFGIRKQKATTIESLTPKSVIRKDMEAVRTWMAYVVLARNNVSDLRTNHTQSQLYVDDVLKLTNTTEEELKHSLGLKSDMNIIKHLKPDTRRRKRNADGSSSTVNYCTDRGSPADNGFLHLCSACALTTRNADDKFPRYINEVTCNEDDCNCFSRHGTDYGRCVPIVHTVQMLRRKVGGCRMVVNNGQISVVDDWEVYNQIIHTGCECVFNKISPYSQFVLNT